MSARWSSQPIFERQNERRLEARWRIDGGSRRGVTSPLPRSFFHPPHAKVFVAYASWTRPLFLCPSSNQASVGKRTVNRPDRSFKILLFDADNDIDPARALVD